jgi:hypothetical protein
MNAEFIFKRDDDLQHLQRRQFQITLISVVALAQNPHNRFNDFFPQHGVRFP